MVQGPVPVTVTVPTVAVPIAVALTLPDPLPVVVGAVQPAGTTMAAADPAVKAFGPLRKLKVKLLPLLPRGTLVGETVMVPSPLASVNVADAVSWEVSP